MSSDLRELYQSVILDHNKHPRNYCKPACTNRTAEGVNPLCGDQLTIYLDVEDGVVKDVGFSGTGCAISTASASLMTQTIKGMKIEEAERLFEGFREMVTSDPKSDPRGENLGKLSVFSGVREFPMRVKCATLAWHAMSEALHDTGKTATTE
ncbi:MAG: SUF system NifU family Fe-S cluster assembly protein [Deltaproteobacteria bacterium]|jgi:nitrogen fixation NifU-like protein|nr:SUF system NifU family Fe-S cluster assembly protein [Deltaproteobacteria bacterium]